jgi:tetratricopeptide (TPR) repeat protein
VVVDSVAERRWREHNGDPVALLAQLGKEFDPAATGRLAYQYEREATRLYGLPLHPGGPDTEPTRWDAPARTALDAALKAGEQRSAFFAFSVLATSLRRASNFVDLDDLITKAAPDLSSFPLFDHFQAMAVNEKGYEPERAVIEANRAIKTLGDHAGAHHTLALALLATVDAGSEGQDAASRLRLAESAVNVALRLDHENPRFRLTLGQVYRHLGRMVEARAAVLEARQMDQVANRLADRRRLYDYELLLINTAAELERRIGDVDKRVDERVRGVDLRVTEVAGFITGVVALAVGGANGATAQKSANDVVVVLVTTAVLVFGGALLLGLVLGRRR